ncbi:centrosomal protein of 72 kDa isoform X1 [Hippocampus comes]|uniref:centrosomal protein of 72 kDa isoform X1 n=1 Tax=Hippocampus comes TaxID=109280 RepID=UPI00094E704A|nr:PREDICTED: centrosomal protein of 72 kDa isoform X1 [Hippocampus comes]
MAPLTLVALTEEWIMNKLGLSHQRLGDVRSLSLPGTYNQKIGYLGNGLANFERLKSLNLSHNSIVSVEGLQHLKHLQILNLYYNCIPSLEEVKVLFELPVLRDLDLRLNPLGKTDPNYRPYVVHAMAGLRKLDGCLVKDAERKSAKRQYSQQRNRNNRQALVERLSRKLSLLNDTDGVELNHTGANHRSGSYSNAELQSSNQQPAQEHQYPSSHHSGSNPVLYPSWVTEVTGTPAQAENKQQESYRKPLGELLDLLDKHWVGERTLQLNTNFLSEFALGILSNCRNLRLKKEKKSSHSFPFLDPAQIVQILSMMENRIYNQDAEIKTLKEEVGALCLFAATQERQHRADVNKFTADLGELNVQLRVALEENVALRKELLTSERMYRQYMTEHPPTSHNIEAQRRVEEVKEELEELRRRVKQAQSANEPPQVRADGSLNNTAAQ